MLDIFLVLLVAGLGIAALPWTERELAESWGSLAAIGSCVRRIWGARRPALAIERVH